MPKDPALTKRTMEDLIATAADIERAQRLNSFPRTVNKTCTWDCEFKDPCIVEYFGGDASSLLKANYERTK